MLLGPVFNAELLMTARRSRYYVIRFLYGLIILFQVYLTYEANINSYGYGRRSLNTKEMAEFGLTIFSVFAILQAVVVMLLTPALVAGTVADERQRKTLHYLLTSQLSGIEIVLSKLGARLLHVGVLVALGLPVICLLGLFGGIDFWLLLLTYAGTITTIYFLSTLSILVSVVSRRPREAISLVYLLELGWLIVPVMLMSLIPTWPEPWPSIFPWLEPPLRCVAITSPISLMNPMLWGPLRNPFSTIFWGMGLQVLYGTAFVTLAALRLRPAFRSEGEGRWSRAFGWTKRITKRRRLFSRPECGDDAMLWKERYVSRSTGLSRLAMTILGLGLVGILGYEAWVFGMPAALEMWEVGYFNGGRYRRDLTEFVKVTCTGLYVLWMIAVASASASSLTSEREEDTWLSLTATPLSGREIILAKMVGPVWALRPVAFLIFGIWGLGLLLGSLSIWGFAAVALEFAVFTWFLTALGCYFSLKAKNSTRSLASTMALLLFVNGGYLFCCIPLQPDTSAIAFGCTPALFGISTIGYHDLGPLNQRDAGGWFAACVFGLIFYAIGAATLTSRAIGTFDAVVDRPDRDRQRRYSPGQILDQKKTAKPLGIGEDLA